MVYEIILCSSFLLSKVHIKFTAAARVAPMKLQLGYHALNTAHEILFSVNMWVGRRYLAQDDVNQTICTMQMWGKNESMTGKIMLELKLTTDEETTQ
jgi:hypothetical protein